MARCPSNGLFHFHFNPIICRSGFSPTCRPEGRPTIAALVEKWNYVVISRREIYRRFRSSGTARTKLCVNAAKKNGSRSPRFILKPDRFKLRLAVCAAPPSPPVRDQPASVPTLQAPARGRVSGSGCTENCQQALGVVSSPQSYPARYCQTDPVHRCLQLSDLRQSRRFIA